MIRKNKGWGGIPGSNPAITACRGHLSAVCLLFAVLFLMSSCAATGPNAGRKTDKSEAAVMKGTDANASSGENALMNAQKAAPDFAPVSEELSPLKTRLVSVEARGTPLRDVLYLVAKATGLNLVMEKGVDPEMQITLTLNSVSAEDALKTIFASADYFYSIKDNMLFVKAMETRFFELGQPSMLQDYSVDVGGDITGSASGAAATGTGTGTSSVSTSIKGGVSQKVQADKEALKLWDSVEKTLGTLIGIAATGGTAQAPQDAQGKPQLQPSYSVNRMTGTIVVTAAKKDLEKVENYLVQIKKVLNRQVVIEARIVEVQLSEGLRYGIDWKALSIGKLGQITFGTAGLASTVPQGFEIGLTRWDINGLLRALQNQGNVKVLSNPRINIMNAQTALLSVGRTINFIQNVTTTTTLTNGVSQTTYSVQPSSVLSGLVLGIVPYITGEGEVTMAITPIISDLVKLENTTIGTGGNSVQLKLPTVDLRELSTTVKLKDGQMIIIGGLIQTKESVQDNQVPGLGNIPVLGHLFKGREKTEDRTELIIMLKPTIISQQENNK